MDYLEGTAAPHGIPSETVAWPAAKTSDSPQRLRDFRDWWELAHQLAAEAQRFERGFRELPEPASGEEHPMNQVQGSFEQEAMKLGPKRSSPQAPPARASAPSSCQQLASRFANGHWRREPAPSCRTASSECRERMTTWHPGKASTQAGAERRSRAGNKRRRAPPGTGSKQLRHHAAMRQALSRHRRTRGQRER